MAKLPTLYTLLLVAISVGAITASAAHAEDEGRFVAGANPATVVAGDSSEENGLVISAEEAVECEENLFVGFIFGGGKNLLMVSELGGPLEAQECTAAGFPATVTNNGCVVVWHTTETDSEPNDTWKVTTDLECPTKPIEVHVYANAEHSITICRLTVDSQKSLEGVTIDNIAGNPSDLTATVDIVGVEITQDRTTFFGCPDAKFDDATIYGEMTVAAFDDEDEPVDLAVQHPK